MEEFGFPIDSEYIEAQSLFDDDPESSPKEVIVWTESDDDIRLWMQVFVDNEEYTFTFFPASKFRTADGVASNGCSRLIKLCDTKNIIPGKQNIVCLDSDFKFIAQQSADYNGRDYAVPHFYWTCVHSKEHIFLDCNLVDDIVSHSTCTPSAKLAQRTNDIYSAIANQIYSPMSSLIFLMSLNFNKLTDETEGFKTQFRDCLSILLRLKKGVFNCATCEIWSSFIVAAQELDGVMAQYIAAINKTANLSSFRQRLTDVGVTANNIHFFIRGHDWEPVVKHITKCYLDFLQEKKFQEIKISSNQIDKDIQAARNRTPKFEQALLSIKPRVDSFPFFQKTLREARSIYGSKS